MKQERQEQVMKILESYAEKQREDGKLPELIGVTKDPVSKESNGYSIQGLENNSDTVKSLENLGFKVIYPAKLPEKRSFKYG